MRYGSLAESAIKFLEIRRGVFIFDDKVLSGAGNVHTSKNSTSPPGREIETTGLFDFLRLFYGFSIMYRVDDSTVLKNTKYNN